MDRRQKKSREAIFRAFTELVSNKEFNQITVREIIERADVGRATFYAHFPTKEFLLKELCNELFCHIFDREHNAGHSHKHIFDCENAPDAFQHLFYHLKTNDHNLLQLFSSPNNELFLRYFKNSLNRLIETELSLFEKRKGENVPDAFWKRHIAAVFVETLEWWVSNNMRESAEDITALFLQVV